MHCAVDISMSDDVCYVLAVQEEQPAEEEVQAEEEAGTFCCMTCSLMPI